MGFIIHKYFLSKSLKAPPPSDSKKKKGKASGKNGSSGSGAFSEHLTIPENAYANHASPLYYSPSPGRRTPRRSSLSGSSTHSYRRASMPVASGTSIEEGSVEDSTTTFEEYEETSKPQYRRYSLPASTTNYLHDEASVHTSQDPKESSNSYAIYYSLAIEGKDDIPVNEKYGYEDVSMPRRHPRRSSASSAMSKSEASESSMAPTRLLQENQQLRRQLGQCERQCAMLESKVYRTRDQLAYSHATWMDQFQDAQSRHQDEIFQAQRQAEAASNAILEQEFDALKSALAQEEAKVQDGKKGSNETDDAEEYNIKQLLAELQVWKDRHSLATTTAERVQKNLEQENMDTNAQLKESERRVDWLEEQLELAVLSNKDNDASGTRFIALLKSHQSQLEERVDELLLENANLQQDLSESYALQGQVKELQEALNESKTQLSNYQAWHAKQVEHFQQDAAKWRKKAESLKERLSLQVTSREAIRGEYAQRIEDVETENVRLNDLLRRKQDEWNHRINLKERTIESLRLKLGQIDDEPTAAPPVAMTAPGSLQQAGEKDLLLQISRLMASEADARKQLASAEETIKRLSSSLDTGDPSPQKKAEDDGYKFTVEYPVGHSFDQSTLDDDASIDELLDEL